MDDRVYDPVFASHVQQGLTASPKKLSSRYFYDARGDRLFQAIMASPDYYLTDAEMDILKNRGSEIARFMAAGGRFDLVELGAGDGSKMVHLLDALHAQDAAFVYRPLDISPHVLEMLEARLQPGRNWLEVRSLAINYFEWLSMPRSDEHRRIYAFMGSNLGNFAGSAAAELLSTIRSSMNADDLLLIGLDLKKDPAVIRAAYNDRDGHTAAFNLNLLRRINNELGGEFDLTAFSHQPTYNPETGAARSFLRSEKAHKVYIAAIGQIIDFAEGETIDMEISQKYDDDAISSLAAASGFEVVADFRDARGWFTDQLWSPLRHVSVSQRSEV